MLEHCKKIKLRKGGLKAQTCSFFRAFKCSKGIMISECNNVI